MCLFIYWDVSADASFFDYLVELVEEGSVPEARLDESVRRILKMKEQLGLFDSPVPAVDDVLVKV